MKTKFRYGDKVKITDGFWEGYEGVINDCRYDVIPVGYGENVIENIQYEIFLELGKGDIRDVWIKENWLKKVK